jgi:hypothetical protein
MIHFYSSGDKPRLSRYPWGAHADLMIGEKGWKRQDERWSLHAAKPCRPRCRSFRASRWAKSHHRRRGHRGNPQRILRRLWKSILRHQWWKQWEYRASERRRSHSRVNQGRRRWSRSIQARPEHMERGMEVIDWPIFYFKEKHLSTAMKLRLDNVKSSSYMQRASV